MAEGSSKQEAESQAWRRVGEALCPSVSSQGWTKSSQTCEIVS